MLFCVQDLAVDVTVICMCGLCIFHCVRGAVGGRVGEGERERERERERINEIDGGVDHFAC